MSPQASGAPARRLDVIVPVYNVEKYLRKCLDSILAQTLMPDRVILVDDGSTDSSGQICDEYASKHSIFHVIHQKNMGLSGARNAGLDISDAEYIGFVDSDDYIAPEMYQVLYENLNREDADLSCCGRFHCYANKPARAEGDYCGVLDSKQAIQLIMQGKGSTLSAVNKLYKKRLFDTIRYPVGKTYEDAFVIVDILLRCQKVVVTSRPLYYYVHRAGSITTNAEKLCTWNIIEAHESNYKKIMSFCPDLHSIAKTKVYWAYFMALDGICLSESDDVDKDFTEIAGYLRQNIKDILFHSSLSKKRKALALLLGVNACWYRRVVRYLYERLHPLY